MAKRKIDGQGVKYPLVAREQGEQGTVMLSAVIDKSGNIADLEVISGPRDLRQACIDAVRAWKYQPYLLNGLPIEVRTVVNVVFTQH
jgi:protein TonB